MGKDLQGIEIGKGLIQRADKIYMGRFVDCYGKRRTLYNKDLKLLKKQLQKERYESENGILLNGNNMTLSEWFNEFLRLYKENKVKDVTVHRIRQTYSPVKKRNVGMMKLLNIRAIHFQKLFNELHEEGFSYGTLSLLKSLLNEMYKKAIGNGYVIINPLESVVLPKKEKYEQRYLTEQEQDMFLESAKGYSHEDIFLTNLSLGCRIGELLGLKWSDIDFENKTIHIQRTLHYSRVNDDEKCHFFFTTTKTETSDRTIPLLPETEAILKRVRRKQLQNKMVYSKEWKQNEPFIDMVFTTQKGMPIRYGDVLRTIKTVIAKANLLEEEIAKLECREPYYLKEFSPHCFRHTFVTRAKGKGIDYQSIQAYVGHSNKETTQYYDHNKPVIDVDSMKKISFIKMV